LSESESEDKPTENSSPPPGGALPSNQSQGGTTENHPLLLEQPGNMRPDAPPPEGVVERGQSDEIHCFCFAIDIRSVRNLSQQRPLHIWLR